MRRTDSNREIRRLIDSGDFISPDGIIAYRIYRDRRVRCCRLRWTFGTGLTITFPWKAFIPSVESIFVSKRDWLVCCIRKDRLIQNSPGLPKLEPGGEMLYLGRMIPIIGLKSLPKQSEIMFEEDQLRINSDDIINVEPRIIALAEAKKQDDIAGDHQETLSGNECSSQKNYHSQTSDPRWASWSSRKAISLNWRLIMAPPKVIEYVILHELTHDRFRIIQSGSGTRWTKSVAIGSSAASG